MFNFWDAYKKNVDQGIRPYIIYTLAFAIAHVIWIKIGLKEASDVFGSFGIENFLMCSLIFLLVGPFIRTYFAMKSSQ